MLSTIQTFEPHHALKPFIRQYIVQEIGNDLNALKIDAIPRGVPCLIFTFHQTTLLRDRFNRSGIMSFSFTKQLTGLTSVCCGQITQKFHLDFEYDSYKVFVIFEPCGFYDLFPCNMTTLTDTFVPLKDLGILPHLEDLEEQINLANHHSQRIEAIEKSLIKLLAKKKPPINPLNKCIPYLTQSNGQISVGGLAEQFNVSRRNLERKFLEQAGITPKQMIGIFRFRLMIKYIATHPEVEYFDLIDQFHYHDQSHLIKDFRKYTGKTPEHFLSTLKNKYELHLIQKMN
jgi:AraC-like DNA-binding protein